MRYCQFRFYLSDLVFDKGSVVENGRLYFIEKNKFRPRKKKTHYIGFSLCVILYRIHERNDEIGYKNIVVQWRSMKLIDIVSEEFIEDLKEILLPESFYGSMRF